MNGLEEDPSAAASILSARYDVNGPRLEEDPSAAASILSATYDLNGPRLEEDPSAAASSSAAARFISSAGAAAGSTLSAGAAEAVTSSAGNADNDAEAYQRALEAYDRLILKDYRREVYMAGLDNVINRYAERSQTVPSEERIANIKVIMGRFYQVMRVWLHEELMSVESDEYPYIYREDLLSRYDEMIGYGLHD